MLHNKLGIVALALCLPIAAYAQKTQMLTVDVPQAAGTVKLTVKDIRNNDGLTIPVTINAADLPMTAVEKATKIVAAANKAAVGTPFTFVQNKDAKGNLLPTITITNTNKTTKQGPPPLTGTFNPGATKEKSQRLAYAAPDSNDVMVANLASTLPPTYALTDSSGIPVEFVAGVTLNSVDYSVDLTASNIDPNYLTDGGVVSSSLVTTDLYNALQNVLTGDNVTGATIANNSDGIDISFATPPPNGSYGPGDYGIIWGTTSPSTDSSGNGFGATLSDTEVPEPASLSLLGLAGLGLLARRRAM